MVETTTDGQRTSPMAMRVQVLGVERGRRIAGEATGRLRAAVASPPIKVTAAQIRFTDENGPKGGGVIRCAITLQIARRAPVHVEDVALSPRLALDRGLVKLERRLARLREGRRASARHPKKYFVAARELLKT